MRCTLIAALAALAAAQNPAQPVWPKEFKANITETDIRENRTQDNFQLYSYSNEAVINDFTDYHRQQPTKVEDFLDWHAKRQYNLFTDSNGQEVCHSRPLDGQIFVPPVATFVYNGTEPAGRNWPVATYRWVGAQQQRGDFIYHTTANAAETPVGFFDFNRGIKTWFQTFTIVTTWPTGTFTVPANCTN